MNFQHANENYGHLCCFKAKSCEKNCYWEKIADGVTGKQSTSNIISEQFIKEG